LIKQLLIPLMELVAPSAFALENDEKQSLLRSGAAHRGERRASFQFQLPWAWQPGMRARLVGMKTESLNSKEVMLIEFNASTGRWRVQSVEDSATMDVLPEKLGRAKSRRSSFMQNILGSIYDFLSNRATSAASELPIQRPYAGERDAAMEQQKATANVFASVFARRPSLDNSQTSVQAEQLIAARENIELIPELARMKEEAFMESEAFTDKIALAERRDVHDKKV
jgi:hypothetical protein